MILYSKLTPNLLSKGFNKNTILSKEGDLFTFVPPYNYNTLLSFENNKVGIKAYNIKLIEAAVLAPPLYSPFLTNDYGS